MDLKLFPAIICFLSLNFVASQYSIMGQEIPPGMPKIVIDNGDIGCQIEEQQSIQLLRRRRKRELLGGMSLSGPNGGQEDQEQQKKSNNNGDLYKDYAVLKVYPEDDDQKHTVRQLNEKHGADEWSDQTPKGGAMLVDVGDAKNELYAQDLEAEGIRYDVMSYDLSNMFKQEMDRIEENQKPVPKTPEEVDDWLANFHRYHEIAQFLYFLQETYPSQVEVINLTETSWETRDIFGVHVSEDLSAKNDDKLIVILEAGVHAREWASPATALYTINQFLTNDTVAPFLKTYELYVIPTINPDGYEYTWTCNRKWRKNRSPTEQGCYGVDINRNWAVGWAEYGASRDPCSVSYCGPAAMSEKETRALGAFMKKVNENHKVALFIDMHSFVQMILWPYGYKDADCENEENYQKVCGAGQKAIQEYSGNKWTIGPVHSTIYPASGLTLDYGYVQARIPFSMAVELRSPDYGFLMPPEEIKPSGEEFTAMLMAMMNEIPPLVETSQFPPTEPEL